MQNAIESSIDPLFISCNEAPPITQLFLVIGIEGEEMKEEWLVFYESLAVILGGTVATNGWVEKLEKNGLDYINIIKF